MLASITIQITRCCGWEETHNWPKGSRIGKGSSNKKQQQLDNLIEVHICDCKIFKNDIRNITRKVIEWSKKVGIFSMAVAEMYIYTYTLSMSFISPLLADVSQDVYSLWDEISKAPLRFEWSQRHVKWVSVPWIAFWNASSMRSTLYYLVNGVCFFFLIDRFHVANSSTLPLSPSL